MAKIALLVEFCPRTRILVDVPQGVSIDRWLENNDNYDKVVEQARDNMCQQIEGYLNGENMAWEEDIECPAGTFRSDNV